MSFRDSPSPAKRTIVNTVYLLTVLTIVFLIALLLFFASLAVFWQPHSEETEPDDPIPEMILLERFNGWTLPRADQPAALPVAATAVALAPATSFPATTSPPAPSPQPFGALIIPEIDVSQPVIPIFVRDGQWDISEIGSQIGHLETTGRHPHDALAMTLTGHVTLPWPDIAGPFADLIFLERGEEIIYRWNGTDFIYEVERIFRVHPAAVELLYEQDGEKLILVTCSGWDFVGRSYEERLLTRAVLVREVPSPQG